MAFKYATTKELNKRRDKWAKIAQEWLQNGFSHEQVIKGLWNKAGMIAESDGDAINIYGFNNNETMTDTRILRKVTTIEIMILA